MPAENLPIQNINNSQKGFLFGQGNTGSENYMTFAMGLNCVSIGYCSYAEGQSTSAVGVQSHAEGVSTRAVGYDSHAEGAGTSAAGDYSHAECAGTIAAGSYSHAEGSNTQASGNYSHTEGYYTIAGDEAMHVGGKYNSTSSNAAFVIGNGTTADEGGTVTTTRSDAFIVDWQGNTSASDFITTAGTKLSETLPIHLVATVTEATAGYVNGHVYIVTGSNS